MPNVPVAIEFGRAAGYDVTTWYGFFAPRGIPPAVTAKPNKAINEIIAEPAIRERLTRAGVVVKGSTPRHFGRFHGQRFQPLEQGPRRRRPGAAIGETSNSRRDHVTSSCGHLAANSIPSPPAGEGQRRRA